MNEKLWKIKLSEMVELCDDPNSLFISKADIEEQNVSLIDSLLCVCVCLPLNFYFRVHVRSALANRIF